MSQSYDKDVTCSFWGLGCLIDHMCGQHFSENTALFKPSVEPDSVISSENPPSLYSEGTSIDLVTTSQFLILASHFFSRPAPLPTGKQRPLTLRLKLIIESNYYMPSLKEPDLQLIMWQKEAR